MWRICRMPTPELCGTARHAGRRLDRATDGERARAAQWSDQMIFEGFAPSWSMPKN